MNSVLVVWPPDPVTSTVNAPSCNEFEYSWLTGTLNVPSAPVTGLSGDVKSTICLFVGSSSVSLTVRDEWGSKPPPSTTNAVLG